MIVNSKRLGGLSLGFLIALTSFGCGGSTPPAQDAQGETSPEALLADDGAGEAAPASSPKVQQGVDAIGAGEFAKAKAVLEEAVAAAPQDPQAVFYLGVAQGGLGENAAAITSLRKALELKPEFPEASLNLSAILLDTGDAQGALHAAEAGLKNAPNDAALLQNKALALSESGDAAAAAEAFKAALAKSKDNEELRFLYAQSLLAAKQEAQATEQLKKLLSSSSVEVLASVADLFGRLHKWDECVQALDRAVEKKDASELNVKRGLCLHGKKDEDGAKAAFEHAIASDANSIQAYFYLGHNLRARGDKKGAKAAFKKASELGPDTKLGRAAAEASKKL